MFALVESLGYLPGEHRVDRADNYQDNGIGEGDHVAGVNVTVADQQIVLSRGIVVHGFGGIDHHPDAVNHDLHKDQHRADNQLRAGRNKGRPLGAVLARSEDPRDPVCLGQESRVDDGEAEAGCEPASVKQQFLSWPIFGALPAQFSGRAVNRLLSLMSLGSERNFLSRTGRKFRKFILISCLLVFAFFAISAIRFLTKIGDPASTSCSKI